MRVIISKMSSSNSCYYVLYLFFWGGGGANMALKCTCLLPEVTRVPVVVGHALHVDNFTLGYATHMAVKAFGLLVL